MSSTLSKRFGRSADITKMGLAIACVATFASMLSTSIAHAGFVESVSIETVDQGTAHSPPALIRISTPTFKAGAGEQNTLTLTRSGKDKYLVRDLTSPLVAGPGCTTVDANTASCDILNTSNVVADTSDQDDTITIEGKDTSASIDAGSGSDVITDRDGTSTLTGGGGGHDQINAGGGDDTLSDGDSSSAFDNDILDGGSGTDTIKSYEKRTDPVTIDLGSGGPAGQQGENDQIANAESAYGGLGSDTLTGALGNPSDITGTAYSKLLGGAGDDLLTAAPLAAATALSGGDGNDQLTGGNGHDYIHGDAGDDRIDGAGGFDDLSGETGNDVISGGSSADRIGGGDGDDNIFGGAGNDAIDAGRGKDRVAGDAGTNRIFVRDRQRDRVTCARGSRGLVWVDRLDSVSRFCKATRRKLPPPIVD